MRKEGYYLRLFWRYNLVFEVDIPLKKSRSTIKKGKALPEGYGKRIAQQISQEFHGVCTDWGEGQGGVRNSLSPRQGVLMLNIQHRTKWARIYCGGSKIGLCLPNSVVPGGEHSRITKLVRADCPWNTLSFYVSIFLFVCAFWTLALF